MASRDTISLLPPFRRGLGQLAVRLLNIVPNSAATVFSHFGIIHTKHRNRLSPEKVRKQTLPKTSDVLLGV
ncbi:hypothetical protein BJ138DRAFT_1167009 [Hygrophoropsis aurantiaca]|uniref:Uncharacterized protein n=1 Tax=Hygrophoropsis aurantiaca TaxID=72124 RepID=A0ACB7ZTI8_9AGAM|nr:hypothetical protein BJ138DRAFT_1167009 [Hygrophoropsis aurantiaca]